MIVYPPRLTLANLPTPLSELKRFEIAGFDGKIWVKRDELTGTEDLDYLTRDELLSTMGPSR